MAMESCTHAALAWAAIWDSSRTPQQYDAPPPLSLSLLPLFIHLACLLAVLAFFLPFYIIYFAKSTLCVCIYIYIYIYIAKYYQPTTKLLFFKINNTKFVMNEDIRMFACFNEKCVIHGWSFSNSNSITCVCVCVCVLYQ